MTEEKSWTDDWNDQCHFLPLGYGGGDDRRRAIIPFLPPYFRGEE
ncbi:MAG: hypothetical protein WCX74_02645 [Candidatus Paceibacterota bacterium]